MFLRSGILSASTAVLRQKGAQTGQTQFFKELLSNHVSPGDTLDMLQELSQASGCQSMTGLSDFCSYSQDGRQARSVNFPYEIRFDAPNRSQFPINTGASDMEVEVCQTFFVHSAWSGLQSIGRRPMRARQICAALKAWDAPSPSMPSTPRLSSGSLQVQ